ncbi:formate dehydrogenase accessory sulfurtransferase FdhD, partial [Staphylococcus saprophyticus]|uniref:formate dehydrogenase accessory sulfurtransferase FdhD n=1 Tax=Staphylococcus saprophyticus TaxID=29385 RepID=UPI00386BF0E2
QLTLPFLPSEPPILTSHHLNSIQIHHTNPFPHLHLTKSLRQPFHYSTKPIIPSSSPKTTQFYFQNHPPLPNTSISNIQLNPQQLLNIITPLQTASQLFKQTAGLHNPPITDPHTFFQHPQHIPPHNPLHKLYRYSIQTHIPLPNKLLI